MHIHYPYNKSSLKIISLPPLGWIGPIHLFYDMILKDPSWVPDKFLLADHIGGFDSNLQNKILQRLNNFASQENKIFDITITQIFTNEIIAKYPNLKITFSMQWQEIINTGHFYNYNMHPELDYKNFICSFNGSQHVSRTLLVSILDKFKFFVPEYCSKNFQFTSNNVDEHLLDYLTPDQARVVGKFFVNSSDFQETIHSFGHVRFAHADNIYNLENKLTQSFLHIVSETLATSYYPFVTEKFLYSVVTRGLFLAYAQPGWHNYVGKYYGFKKYTKLFDYQFDTIQNPIIRLLELVSMISKFSLLSKDDWQDLYLLEQDTIEYNYDHYFSKNYLKVFHDQV
jgi:hypothetical protein